MASTRANTAGRRHELELQGGTNKLLHPEMELYDITEIVGTPGYL